MKLTFKETALLDIKGTADYIAENLGNPTAAKRLTRRVFEAATLLKDNPWMGASLGKRLSIDSDIRYLVVERQMLFNRVIDDTVTVIRVLDGRQDYISILFNDS